MTSFSSKKLPLIWGFTSLLVCLGLTYIVAQEVKRENYQVAENKTKIEAERLADATLERLQHYEFGLKGTRSFILGIGDNLAHANFVRFSQTRDFQKEYPGARGLGFIRRVPVNKEAAFIKEAKLDNSVNFSVHQLSPSQQERYVIQYIEPIERNFAAVGLDIGSEKFRRHAADTAIKTGEANITAPITLVQATGHPQQSFLILLPIYRDWETPSESERWEKAIGWTYAPLSMQEILDSLEIDKTLYHLQLTDITDQQNSIPFYGFDEKQNPFTLHHQRLTRFIYGRTWQFDISANPSLMTNASRIRSKEVIMFGGLISVLVTLIAAALGINRKSKLKLAAEESALAAIVESTHDAIIGKALDGTITSWNRGAEEIFGYSRSEAIGNKIVDLIIPDRLKAEENEILTKIKNDENISQFVTKRVTKNGNVIDVLVNVSPIKNSYGKVVSASKTVRDITGIKATERKIVELNTGLEIRVHERTRELEDARRSLQTLLDAVPSVISYWDSNLANRFANHAHIQRFGVSVSDISNMNFSKLIGYEMFTFLLPFLESALAGNNQKIEYTTVLNNREHHFLIQLLPDNNKKGTHGFYFIEHDITEQIEGREMLAKALREQQALHNTVNAQFLYSVTDTSGNILEVNDQFCASTGYTREYLIGQNHRIMNSGIHPREFWQKMWTKVKQGLAWRSEICNLTAIGELRWFDSVIAPILDANGKVEKFIALGSDITNRKRAEEHRNQLNLLIENILSAASEVSIIVTDIQGTITMFNRGSERMLGYTASEMVNKNTPALIHLESEVIERGKELLFEYGFPIEGFRVFVHKAEAGQPETRRWTYVKKNGSNIQVSLTVTAMRDPTGNLIGFLGIASDITEQFALESALRNEKENADFANKAKSQFLANMSHEIRTPLNAVLGMLQLVQKTSLTHNQMDYISKSKSAATSLLDLLNDILDFSKIEAGKLVLDPYPFSIDELLKDLSIIMAGNQKNKNIELIFDVPVDFPKEIIADQLRIKQILVNLVGNALKFTESGYVKLGIERLNQTKDELVIRISVEDTGIGISLEHQQKIFAGFTQAEASTTRRYGGTGLGLVICKRLAHLMNSELHLESDLGKGSHFWFDLTLPIANNEIEKYDLSFEKKLKILLVDDNQLLVELLKSSLASIPWEIDIATSGEEALERILTSAEQDKTYDVVALDWRMPDIDGIAVTRKIHSIPGISKPSAIIMITAYEREMLDSISDYDRQYISTFLVKPITPKQLIQSIEQCLHPELIHDNLTNQNENKMQLQNINVLVVEDNELNRQVAYELLSSAGANVDMAEGGIDGVAKVTSTGRPYDLVIMDIQMPDIDGFEATRRIRKDSRFMDLPILAMTANASESDRQECLAAGMNEHTGKPFDFQKLIPLILSMIKTKSDSQPSTTNIINQELAQDKPLLEDLTSLLNRYAGNIELFQRFQKKFRPDVEKLISVLTTAVENNKINDARSALHSIKGLSATLGASALARLASDLEAKCKQGEIPGQDQIEELNSMMINSDKEMEKMANRTL